MSKTVSRTFSVQPKQIEALEIYQFSALIKDQSKALRELMRAGLVAIAADTSDATRSAAALKALDAWPQEPSK